EPGVVTGKSALPVTQQVIVRDGQRGTRVRDTITHLWIVRHLVMCSRDHYEREGRAVVLTRQSVEVLDDFWALVLRQGPCRHGKYSHQFIDVVVGRLPFESFLRGCIEGTDATRRGGGFRPWRLGEG